MWEVFWISVWKSECRWFGSMYALDLCISSVERYSASCFKILCIEKEEWCGCICPESDGQCTLSGCVWYIIRKSRQDITSSKQNPGWTEKGCRQIKRSVCTASGYCELWCFPGIGRHFNWLGIGSVKWWDTGCSDWWHEPCTDCRAANSKVLPFWKCI